MSISVNTTNAVSGMLLHVGTNAGSLALAAHLLNSPMGAGGGAIFGAVHVLSKTVLRVATDKFLNRSHPAASSVTKTLSAVIEYFGSYAAAWGVLATMGISLTLAHIFSIVVVSCLTSLIVDWALRVFSPTRTAPISN